MCYFLVEGFRYTHSRKQYALRLFGFGVVSQVPFSMAFAQNGILEFQDFNMMFTLFLCFCILLCIETIRNRFLRGVLIVLLIFGSLFCDWALLAPVFTLLFRWSGQDQKRLRFSFALSAALFGWLNYTSSVWLYPTAQCMLLACGSMALLLGALLLPLSYRFNSVKARSWLFLIIGVLGGCIGLVASVSPDLMQLFNASDEVLLAGLVAAFVGLLAVNFVSYKVCEGINKRKEF